MFCLKYHFNDYFVILFFMTNTLVYRLINMSYFTLECGVAFFILIIYFGYLMIFLHEKIEKEFVSLNSSFTRK